LEDVIHGNLDDSISALPSSPGSHLRPIQFEGDSPGSLVYGEIAIPLLPARWLRQRRRALFRRFLVQFALPRACDDQNAPLPSLVDQHATSRHWEWMNTDMLSTKH